MKKILTMVLVLCLSSITSPFLRGQTPPDDPEETIIIIEKKSEENNPPSGPKAPSAIRLQAYYDCASSEIVVSARNAGTNISVSVENLVSGESSLFSISGNSVSYMPISGTSGYWLLTFTLENGSVYIGQFTL
ncbi:MAG: hypothetical protein IJQ35_03600 [Bacteroidales bacterium]|nr:hypothetical protein [Bacteroidales bacterium]